MAVADVPLPAGLKLYGLRLQSCKCESKVLVPNPQLSAENTKVRMNFSVFEGGVLYELIYSVQGRDLILDKVICEISCTFHITYGRTGEPTEAQLRAVAADAFWHATMYLREFLQTQTRLMGLPPFVLDVVVPPAVTELTRED